jgi:hydrogenase maturation factor
MCLGQLVRCVGVAVDGAVRVRAGSAGSAEQVVSLLMMDAPVSPGDWLVVHSGYALTRISAEEAHEAESIRRTAQQEVTS